MEPIIYKPFCGYRGLGWTLIIVTFIFCLLSVIFFIPALLLLLLALFMLRATTVTVVLDDAGVRILHEKTCRDRLFPGKNCEPTGWTVILEGVIYCSSPLRQYLQKPQSG